MKRDRNTEHTPDHEDWSIEARDFDDQSPWRWIPLLVAIALLLFSFSARADDGLVFEGSVGANEVMISSGSWISAADLSIALEFGPGSGESSEIRIRPPCWLRFDHSEDDELGRAHVYEIKCVP